MSKEPQPLSIEAMRMKWTTLNGSMKDAIIELMLNKKFLSNSGKDSKEIETRRDMMIDITILVNKKLRILFNELEERIRHFSEFYERYVNNPRLLMRERGVMFSRYEEIEKLANMGSFEINIYDRRRWCVDLSCLFDQYNNWLFKTSVRGIIAPNKDMERTFNKYLSEWLKEGDKD